MITEKIGENEWWYVKPEIHFAQLIGQRVITPKYIEMVIQWVNGSNELCLKQGSGYRIGPCYFPENVHAEVIDEIRRFKIDPTTLGRYECKESYGQGNVKGTLEEAMKELEEWKKVEGTRVRLYYYGQRHMFPYPFEMI